MNLDLEWTMWAQHRSRLGGKRRMLIYKIIWISCFITSKSKIAQSMPQKYRYYQPKKGKSNEYTFTTILKFINTCTRCYVQSRFCGSGGVDINKYICHPFGYSSCYPDVPIFTIHNLYQVHTYIKLYFVLFLQWFIVQFFS